MYGKGNESKMYCMRQGGSGEAMSFSAIYVVSGSIGHVIQVKNLIYMYLWLLHAIIIIIT